MSNQENEKKQESKEQQKQIELIDITEILRDYFRIFRRMLAWVLIFCVLGAGLFYVRARFSYTPQYTASATFTINIQQEQQNLEDGGTSTFFDNSAAEQMAKTFPYILTSGVLKRKVAKDMGTATVAGNIQASVAENTNLLTISVTDRDAGRAYSTLKSVVENYPSVAEVIVGKTYMEMLDETGIPAKPDNPKDFKTSAIKGAIVGFLLVALWVGLLVVTRRTIRKERDVRKWMHTKCLGSIPQIRVKRRTRMTEKNLIITEESVEQVLQEPLRIIRNKIEHHAKEYDNRVFLITSALAGEGKSTVAVNLALSLAQTGQRVALIDCDLRHP
ncbi:MAG: YveK family protein, partial [Lachnospiraceae bacterium]